MKTKILSTNLESTNYEQVFSDILTFLNQKNDSAYITVNNVHTVVEGVVNAKYGEILNNSFQTLPDGRPLSIVASWKGDKQMQRVFGPTLMEKIIDWGQGHNIKHFFWGSTESTLDKMETVIKKKYPKAVIAGTKSPPFRELSVKENQEFLEKMNTSGADIVWIGLGAPKQELWMSEHFKKLEKGIMIGIGAGFDYLAGNTSHAPDWMKKYALEWFYRLIQEPGRLWKRYLVTNTLFIVYLILEFLHIKKFNN
ncbi:MAG: WecB/TagA/CpsF family glycosyltransferase [Calditrichaeota bacterium]|nr:WecB/TagA/CpsF family glycosyltransferase [Calditrichota bacterium]